MYELSAGPPLEERLLLIRSVKSNKALLLEEVTRVTSERQSIYQLWKEETYDG